MKIKKIIYSTLLVVNILMLAINTAQACSMYKITINGKTVDGCNEDAWRTTPRAWFETAKLPSEYGEDLQNGFLLLISLFIRS